MEKKIFSGYLGNGHGQGIAVDPKGGFIYYSQTTKLVKGDLKGNIIGSVKGIVGHLGCIDFNDGDGRVYGSLEYKNDAICRGILGRAGISSDEVQNGFYIAIFDVDKIDRMDMDAETDGVMKTVYLKTVVDDYDGEAVNMGKTYPHVHGCSGIDGVTIGPDFGACDGKQYLHVSYGVYSNLERTDNDYQVILQYDIEDWWSSISRVHILSQMHRSGPAEPRRKYFVYTGNTVFGVQNMEYDAHTGDYFLCVYNGRKPQFPNYPMYVIDGSAAAREETLRGVEPACKGLVLTLRQTGLSKDGISGMDFPHGSMGFYSFGDGRFYVSEAFGDDNGWATNMCLYRLNRENGTWTFERE